MFMGESSENLRRLRHAAQIDTIPHRPETRANPAYYAFGHSVNRTAVIKPYITFAVGCPSRTRLGDSSSMDAGNFSVNFSRALA
jgi:hypothetical protein